jgi:hypothetical protein
MIAKKPGSACDFLVTQPSTGKRAAQWYADMVQGFCAGSMQSNVATIVIYV